MRQDLYNARMQRLAASIAADQASARAELQGQPPEPDNLPNRDRHGGIVGRTQGGVLRSPVTEKYRASPLKDKAQVLGQCVETCIAEHHILALCLELDLSDDEGTCAQVSSRPGSCSQDTRLTEAAASSEELPASPSTTNGGPLECAASPPVAILTPAAERATSVGKKQGQSAGAGCQEEDAAEFRGEEVVVSRVSGALRSERLRRECARALLRPSARLQHTLDMAYQLSAELGADVVSMDEETASQEMGTFGSDGAMREVERAVELEVKFCVCRELLLALRAEVAACVHMALGIELSLLDEARQQQQQDANHARERQRGEWALASARAAAATEARLQQELQAAEMRCQDSEQKRDLALRANQGLEERVRRMQAEQDAAREGADATRLQLEDEIKGLVAQVCALEKERDSNGMEVLAAALAARTDVSPTEVEEKLVQRLLQSPVLKESLLAEAQVLLCVPIHAH